MTTSWIRMIIAWTSDSSKSSWRHCVRISQSVAFRQYIDASAHVTVYSSVARVPVRRCSSAHPWLRDRPATDCCDTPCRRPPLADRRPWAARLRFAPPPCSSRGGSSCHQYGLNVAFFYAKLYDLGVGSWGWVRFVIRAPDTFQCLSIAWARHRPSCASAFEEWFSPRSARPARRICRKEERFTKCQDQVWN